MSNYFIHIYQLVYHLVPYYLRTDFLLQWLSALLHPLQSINLSLYHLANSIRYKTAFNGSVILLEHVLNDTFDPDDRGIYIEDGEIIPYLYESFEDENITQFVYNQAETATYGETYSFFQSEIEANYVDFIVNIPAGLGLLTTSPRLLAYINYYKLTGKSYRINLY